MSGVACLEQKREQGLVEVMNTITHELRETFPVIFEEIESFEILFSDVVIPVSQLAMKIKISTSRYAFFMGRKDRSSFNLPAKRGIFSHYTLIDIDTRKTVRSDTSVTSDDEASFGHLPISLELGFGRINQDSSMTVLRKAKALVKLCRPLGKRNP